MIKINLAKNLAAGPVGSASDLSSDENQIRKQGAMKLLLVFLGPVLLIVLEQQLVPEKQAELNRLRAQLTEVSSKNSMALDAVQQMKKLTDQRQELQKQIDILEDLRAERSLEVRVLDTIQRNIPGGLWLSRIQAQEGKYRLEGSADADVEVAGFMESLSKVVFIKDVRLVRSVADGGRGSRRKFEVSFSAEIIP